MIAFTITFDYLCPFARNGSEHVLAGLAAGADWDVTYLPYSLAQGHVGEEEPAVWDRDDPDDAAGVLALQVGLAVRDHFPEHFPDAHIALFAARHDAGEDIKDEGVLRAALNAVDGLDVDAVFEVVRGGEPLETLRKEHDRGVRDHDVWGVPTFVAGDRAVFVRLMTRPEGDGQLAHDTVEHVLDLVTGFPALHELKQTDLPR